MKILVAWVALAASAYAGPTVDDAASLQARSEWRVFDAQPVTYVDTPVPEPATTQFFLTALVIACCRRWRQWKRRHKVRSYL